MWVAIIYIVIFAFNFGICWEFFKKEYIKYFLRTFILPAIIIIAAGNLVWFLLNGPINTINIENTKFVSLLFFLPIFITNILFYFIIRRIKKKEIEEEIRNEELERCSRKQRKIEEQNRKWVEQENRSLENEHMSEIRNMLSAIPKKINALNSFTAELKNKIDKLEIKAGQAISNAYGEFASPYIGRYGGRYANYKELYNNYSTKIDPILSAMCDKMIKKVSEAIAQKQSLISKNADDIQKYRQLQNQMQQEYDRELKIQKMKKISGELSQEISTSEDDVTTSEFNKLSVENALNDFTQLNLAIEERRQLEIQYDLIEI